MGNATAADMAVALVVVVAAFILMTATMLAYRRYYKRAREAMDFMIIPPHLSGPMKSCPACRYYQLRLSDWKK